MSDTTSDTTLAIETIACSFLHLDVANVRRHPEKNISGIKASLARFGQQKPLVIDANNVVRAGNGTLEAARALGWETIQCVRTGLSGTDATAYSVADNRLAETSEWDYEDLATILKALDAEDFDLSVLGWSDHELGPLLAADWAPPAVEPMPQGGGEAAATDKPHTLAFSAAQWEQVEAAAAQCRETNETPDLPYADCVALALQRWLDEQS